MNMVHASICLCLFKFLSSVLCSFLSTGLLHPWLGLFLGTLFFLFLYQMGFFSWFLFLLFHCWCTKMPLISEYWLCILLLCQIHLLGWVDFFVESMGFLCTISCHLQTVTVLLPPFQFGCLLFIYFFVWSLWLELPILC